MKSRTVALILFICTYILLTITPVLAEWTDPTKYESSVSIALSAVTLNPVGNYSNLYKSGAGAMADLSYVPAGSGNLKYSFKTGALKMKPETETDDGYATGNGTGYLLPLLANLEYRITMPFWRRLKIAPELSAGMTMIRIKYDDRSGMVKNGTPTGKAALKGQKKNSADPMALGGLNVLFLVNYTDYIFLGGDYGMIYETKNSMYFVSANLGYEVRF